MSDRPVNGAFNEVLKVACEVKLSAYVVGPGVVRTGVFRVRPARSIFEFGRHNRHNLPYVRRQMRHRQVK